MIYSKNGNNGIEKKLKLSLIKNDSLNNSKNFKADYIKSIDSHPDMNIKIMSKDSSPSKYKKNDILKTLYKSKTIVAKNENNSSSKKYNKSNNLTVIVNKKFTEKSKSNTFQSKPQSLVNALNESFMRISNKQLNFESDMGFHSEEYNQSLYFQINNNKANQKYKLHCNKISTTKYNILTFLPKGLLLQFTRLPNIFFLFTAIIQSIPVISPLTSLTAIVPLIFVLGVSLIREFIEDWARKTYDDMNNKEEVIVFRDGYFQNDYSETLRSGEVILVTEGKTIPADMVLLDSGMREGIAYVETSSLDGEKALKFKLANKETIGSFSDEKNRKELVFKNLIIGGEVEISYPNPNLNEINGKVKFILKRDEKSSFSAESKTTAKTRNGYYEITNKEFILKGSILRSTNWIIGIVVYTGMNNKIILNSKKPRTKISQIEKKMNYYLLYVFFFLMLCCLICSIMHNHGYEKNKNFYNNFINLQRSALMESFITFFTYFLLLNTMIPISLIVTIEIIKMIQGFFIEWDTKLYSKFRHVFCRARAVSINEELGNVNFIFSDKTGTLTLNQLKFKFCIINKKCYEHVLDINFTKSFSLKQETKILESLSFVDEIIPFHENYFCNAVIEKRKYIKENKHKKSMKQNLKEMEENIYIIDEFWKAITLTNECMVSEEEGELKYLGTSPDDNELVKTANKQGYKLFKTSINKKQVLIGDEEYTFEILHVLGFSSERKRMSIIIRDGNKIKIYSKGADIEITKRLSLKSKKSEKFEFVSRELDNFSKMGYRTLMVASRVIKESDYYSWINNIRKSEKYQKNSIILEKLYDIIECNFELLGGTVLEDKLQHKVPETITSLKLADIKIWVLTGDKMDTVENIGISCNLLSYNEKIFKIKMIERTNDDENDNEEYNDGFEIINFIADFKYFLEKNIQELKEKKNLHIFPQYHYNNLNLNNLDSFEQNSISDSDLNIKYLHSLKEKRLINNFSIIIESPLLNTLFKDEELTEKFLSIAQYATTVMCCRASPYQKSQVVQKMKRFNPKFVTLAIGDGRNDISMLMEANIGIGIYGEEGTSAAQAADFAIGEFKLLGRLLFFHGRVNMNRISQMIVYFFYKNFMFTMTQFFFAFYNLSSGQTLMDDWYITCYNLIFTAFPLCVCSLTDIDIKEEDSEECKKCMPLLYKESRDTNRLFTFKRFIFVALKSIILSGIIFLLCAVKSFIIDEDGNHGNIWYMSLKNYCCILIVVSINLFIEVKFIAYYLPLVVFITTFLFFALFLLLVHYGLVFNFNSKASIFFSFSVLKFYLVLFIVSTLNAIFDYSIKLYKIFFIKNLSGQLSLRKALLTTDEAVKKEIMKNNSILRSEFKKEELKHFYKNNSSINGYNGDNNNDLSKNKSNDSSLIESSQIKMYQGDTLSPLYNINKTRNKISVDKFINKINSSLMSGNFSNQGSIKSIEDNNNLINLNNNYNDYSSRKGIVYNGSFKGSKNNNAINNTGYTIKINNNSLNNKYNIKNIDTTINPFNNFLMLKNPSMKLSSKNSAIFGKDKSSNFRKSFENYEASENNNIENDNINDNNNEENNQNIKIYNVKKNNNFYLMLK